MGTFMSLAAPAATLGLTAMGMPVAGMAAGSVFGALSANEMRKQQQAQRQSEMMANAASIRDSWARSKGQTPQLEVQDWQGEAASMGAGATKGLEQAIRFQNAMKRAGTGEQEDPFKEQVGGLLLNEDEANKATLYQLAKRGANRVYQPIPYQTVY